DRSAWPERCPWWARYQISARSQLFDSRSNCSLATVDLGLQGQVVLITGAGQGLGKEIGLAFAREGARVAFHYHSSGGGAEEAAAEAGRLTGAALAVQADIRSDDDVAAAVTAVESQLGPIGVLVNNAAATGAKPFL